MAFSTTIVVQLWWEDVVMVVWDYMASKDDNVV